VVRLATLAAVCVLTVEIIAIPAAGQQIGLMMVTRPDQAVARAAQWADAVLTHSPGAGDAAITAVADWSSDNVLNLLVELASIRLILKDPDTRFFPLPIDFEGRGGPKEIRYTRAEHATLLKTAAQVKSRRLSDIEFIARAIVLHSDIAILGNGTGNMLRTVDGTRMEADFRQADHWSMSRRLAQLLDKKAGRDATSRSGIRPPSRGWPPAKYGIPRMSTHRSRGSRATRRCSSWPGACTKSWLRRQPRLQSPRATSRQV